jgi:cytochrome P450
MMISLVPPGTTVQIPSYSCTFPLPLPSYTALTDTVVHRDSRCFSPDPTAFWPERWLPQEGPKLAAARGLDFQLNTGAFIPFSHGMLSYPLISPLSCCLCRHSGPANCVGRALAMVEMRFVLAALIRRFDFALAPGFEPGDWTDNLGDAFAMTHGKLLAVVRARSS